MGGWRCSYRNCSMKYDGKTHMFHYPVFDKVRCHQWLVNTGRLDFLNLKVSQLKNRVICQHHFNKEYFMNFKEDKLTFDAVPSLDGPFCDAGDSQNKSLEDTTNSLPVIIDIDNEFLTLKDKKANYSVKYADFLSNDLADIDISTHIPQHNVFNEGVEIEKSCSASEPIESKDTSISEVYVHKLKPSSVNNNKASTYEINKKSETQPVQVVPPYNTEIKQNQSKVEENFVEIELPPGFLNNNALLSDDGNINNTEPIVGKVNGKLSNKQEKVRILSEKRISEPLIVTGTLEPVSPSSIFVLRKPSTSTLQQVSNDVRYLEPVPPSSGLPLLQNNTSAIQSNSQKISNEVILNNQEILFGNEQFEPVQTLTDNKSVLKKEVVKVCKVRQENKAKSPRTSLLKNKITPERVAAIKEKRKFNMKLRDMIETFLDKLDEQDKDSKYSSNMPSQYNKLSINQSKSLNITEQTISSLEARMKLMENALISKIDKNSQSINEIKNMILQQNQIEKKTSATQTFTGSQCPKKRLYHEISQYLSPDVNNLIYEELFINKFMKDSKTSVKRKRPS
ncbi:uncharacterized protein LOC128674825 [Plodia interpunctella]|uniref:uncharacterized protein LOC128674825 n=1 Tax=Plodia interpunctella TaxID=58824 RepID=UPI0023682168|nr:uncharacterized protein LOC128674825 [Plodia interpunctella]XP_053609717.1 uncharacterized protein LOC128674825 [Plodia interpunctella]